jgi:hypothetical protein
MLPTNGNLRHLFRELNRYDRSAKNTPVPFLRDAAVVRDILAKCRDDPGEGWRLISLEAVRDWYRHDLALQGTQVAEEAFYDLINHTAMMGALRLIDQAQGEIDIDNRDAAQQIADAHSRSLRRFLEANSQGRIGEAFVELLHDTWYCTVRTLDER